MFDIGLPESFAHIHPVFGELIEIRFATVENVLYGVVIENATEDRWALCYAAQAFGFELLWMLRVDVLGQKHWKYMITMLWMYR